MNINIFGMGYVGVITAGCLCKDVHRVVGVDVSQYKVDLLNEGKSPIIEERIETLLQEAKQSGRFVASTDAKLAFDQADMCIVCVGTPSERNGALNTSFVEGVVSQIGSLIGNRTSPLLIVVRSTLTPGTMRSLVLKILS